MSAPRGVRLYRGFLRLYPRTFREEYGVDMVALLSDQLRDEPAARVWGRCVIDLAVAVPTQRLEAHMKRPSPSIVPIIFAIVSVAALLVALVVGSALSWIALALVVTVTAGSVAVVGSRGTRTVARSVPPTAHWWKLVAGGGIAVGLIAIVTKATGELPEGWWFPTMVVLLASLLTLAAGLLLGVVHFAATYTRHRAA